MEQAYGAAIQTVEKMDKSESKEELWDIFTGFMRNCGADLISYHHIPPEFAPDFNDFQIMAFGFSEDWVTQYTQEKMHIYDPITQLSRFRLNPFRWSEVGNYVAITPKQERYLKSLWAWLKGDGLAIPAFGPSARNGYFGIGCETEEPSWDKNTERTLYWTCQAFHHRFCEFQMKDLPKDFSLTQRESKILNWLAKGYSEEMICGLINARLESIKSSIKIMMKKMGVSDRASLLLRATACGVIEA